MSTLVSFNLASCLVLYCPFGDFLIILVICNFICKISVFCGFFFLLFSSLLLELCGLVVQGVSNGCSDNLIQTAGLGLSLNSYGCDLLLACFRILSAMDVSLEQHYMCPAWIEGL